jgi:hypothetical protein
VAEVSAANARVASGVTATAVSEVIAAIAARAAPAKMLNLRKRSKNNG